MKILLIEDNRAISKGLVYTLEQNGFEVALCENAESTLNSLGGDFDLFIVDVSLPDGNGFELCDEIKRVCETPVIFLTALDDEDSIVKGFDLAKFQEELGKLGFKVREARASTGKLNGYYVTARSGTEYKASEIGKGYTLAHIEQTQKKLKYNQMSISHGNKLTSGKGGFHL